MSDFFSEKDFDPGIGPANDGQNLCTYSWAARTANRLLRDKTFELTTGGRTYRVIEIVKPDSAEKIIADLIDIPLWEGPVKALIDRAKALRGGK